MAFKTEEIIQICLYFSCKKIKIEVFNIDTHITLVLLRFVAAAAMIVRQEV